MPTAHKTPILPLLALALTSPVTSRAATNPDGRGLDVVAAAPQAPPPTSAQSPVPPETKPRSIFRETKLELEQSATTQTLGVGADYQSENPTYDIGLTLMPRLYFVDPPDERQTLSLRAVLAATREFTNSDTTTDRGETTLVDSELWLSYTRKLRDVAGYTTEFSLRLPHLEIPTSKFSYRSGKILTLGTVLGLSQSFPLLEGDDKVLESIRLSASAGYGYAFARAVVPTNAEFSRVRMDPEGASLPGDQLNGAPLAEHQARFRFVAELFITDKLKFTNDWNFRPVWKYRLSDSDVCGVVDTGCTTPESVDDPTRHSVITQFKSEISYDVIEAFSVALGYANLALQLGPDGQRRSVFYSPDARFYLVLAVKHGAIAAPSATKDPPARAKAQGSPNSN